MTRSLPLGPGGTAAPDDTRAFGVKVSYKHKLNTTLVERRGAHSWPSLEYITPGMTVAVNGSQRKRPTVARSSVRNISMVFHCRRN